MALSVFEDTAQAPDAAAVARALGAAAGLWRELVAGIEASHPPVEELWKHAGAKFGWSLRLIRRGRNMVYLTPQEGQFLFGVVLGEKAVTMAHGGGFSEAVTRIVDAAPQHPEGRGVRVPVAGRDDLRVVQQLAELKFIAAG